MGTFFPNHYITYGNRHALVRISENGSIMKSMAMVDFFIENKGTFFPYHYITYGNRHALVRICENGSIMKSMAMVDFFIENKGTFFPHPDITYGNRHSLVRICENGSIMKSMAMVDFFIENKRKLQLKQEDNINHTKELSSHIITLPMETDTLWSVYAKNGSIMKSMAMVDFFIENKDTLWSIICENGSIMKSMAMVDFFIENKGTFFPYHYITYGNRHALVRNFLPISLHYLWKQTRFGRICKNGSIMKSMAMVDFFIENKGKLQLKQQDIINHTNVGKGVNFCVNGNFLPISLHYLWKQTRFGPYLRKWVDNEIHGYGRLLH
ncbi:hypothetical protein H6P81_021521 [Aristolochia fimbriata]|uniref:Homing endonuclease LAGLIDADG domain-containing protein n=1 Tax=Aristolochia fimbriata TaxID=158543 RepID=A0AAV7DUA2_ARIFI|nr:hypothetical protein H6P81_021521 [Aristolochia fimbriata]